MPRSAVRPVRPAYLFLSCALLVPLGGCEGVVLGGPTGHAAADAGVMGDATPARGPSLGAVTHAVDTAPLATPPPVDCTPTAGVCDRAVYDRARAYAAAHPLRDGASWSGWCAALMVRFGGFSRAAPSAISAYHASTIVGHDPAAAPVGAFHFWDIGAYGHVGVDLLGGGGTVFMASSHLHESWGTAIGVNSVSAYDGATGARYLGWSMDYVGQHLAGGGAAACTLATLPAGCAVPPSATATSGTPDTWFWMRMQRFAAANGYAGPINGVLGVHSWAGVQRGLRAWGYTGPDNGVPGVNTYKAMQRLAAAHGYTGPIDGALGPNSYRGLARYLNDAF